MRQTYKEPGATDEEVQDDVGAGLGRARVAAREQDPDGEEEEPRREPVVERNAHLGDPPPPDSL